MDDEVDVDAELGVGGAEPFPLFVARRRPALLRTALLLVGDRAGAELLVQRTLTRCARRWRRLARNGDPDTAVRRALLAGAGGWRARLTPPDQVLESLPDPARPAPAAGSAPQRAEFARRLQQLPGRTRAVVVLRWYEGRSEEATAQLLGRPREVVARAGADGLAALRPALAPDGYERPGTTTDDEQRLRDRLGELARVPRRWVLDGDAAVADVAGRRGTGRRRLAAGALTVACVLGVALPVALPVGAGGDRAVPGQAMPDQALTDQALTDQALTDQVPADQSLSYEAPPDAGAPDEGLPDDTPSYEALPDEGLPDEGLPDESLPDETLPDETLPETVAAGPTGQVPDDPAADPPVLAGPVRGSLAGDAAFLDAVRRAAWGAVEAPPADLRAVVFAGDTPAGRLALVTGPGAGAADVRGVWLIGPPGARADELTVHVPPQLGLDRPQFLLVGGPGPATLVVVAGREDTIEVSDRAKVGPLGTVMRTYTPVPALDGVAVVPARATAAGSATSVRVVRNGRVVHRAGVDRAGAGPAVPADLPALTPRRPSSTASDAGLVAAAVTALAVPLAVEPAELEPEVLWSSQLPDRSRPGWISVLLARSPGGTRLLSTWLSEGGTAVLCGMQTPPSGTDIAAATVARTCTVPRRPTTAGTAAFPARNWLVVSAPPAAAGAMVLDRRDRVLESLTLSGGGAVVPLPEGASTVRTYDRVGRDLADTPVAPMAREPFGDFGTGPLR